MTVDRLATYLQQMQQAASDACVFVEGLHKQDFLEDKKTQQAAVMSLMILGESATKLMDQYPDFVAVNAQIPGRSMRGMRNRIAHGYFEIDLDVFWDTVQTSLPGLITQLHGLSIEPTWGSGL